MQWLKALRQFWRLLKSVSINSSLFRINLYWSSSKITSSVGRCKIFPLNCRSVRMKGLNLDFNLKSSCNIFVKTPWVKAESLHINHILVLSFRSTVVGYRNKIVTTMLLLDKYFWISRYWYSQLQCKTTKSTAREDLIAKSSLLSNCWLGDEIVRVWLIFLVQTWCMVTVRL